MPLRIASFNVGADGRSASVRSKFSALGQTMSAIGKVTATKDGVVVDGDLSTGGLDLERIAAQTRSGKADEALKNLLLKGSVRVRPQYVSYGKYLWRPVQADVTFHRGQVQVLVKEATMCAIDSPRPHRVSGWGVGSRFRASLKSPAIASRTRLPLRSKRRFRSLRPRRRGKSERKDGRGIGKVRPRGKRHSLQKKAACINSRPWQR